MFCIALVLRILEKRQAEDQNTTDFHWKRSKPYRNGYSGSRTKGIWRHLLTESMVPVQAGRVRQVFVVPFGQLAVAPERLCFGWKGCSVPSTAACEIWGVSQKQKLSRSLTPDKSCTSSGCLTLGSCCSYPQSWSEPPTSPDTQAPCGPGKAMKCVSEWIKFMVRSKSLIIRFNAVTDIKSSW